MKLPNLEHAIVEQSKVVDYLLSPTHVDGLPKAMFFGRFGFSPDNWVELADALKNHAAEHEVEKVVPSKYGVRYIIEGEMTGPDGRRPLVRAVWFIESGEEVPRLITAYPPRRRD
jgi:hypothetical protein